MDDTYSHSFAQNHTTAPVDAAPGFWIISVRILDQARYHRYLEMAVDAIDGSGGDIIIRSSAGLAAAGNPKPRIVVVKFATYAAAVDAFKSLSQRAALLMYEQIADYDVLIVEGLDCPL